MTYKDKIIKALSLCETLDDVDYIEQKIERTSQINRRTEVGRVLTRELLNLANQKARQLIREGAVPFN